MSTYDKLTARIPIVPDDFYSGLTHVPNELLIDHTSENMDIHIVNADLSTTNITGIIRDSIKVIKDGSSVIHIYTEDSVPAIADRKENNWYFIIESANDSETGASVTITDYVYYGLMNSYSSEKTYTLIGQNTTSGSSTVAISLDKDHLICCYVPTNYTALFKDHDTGEVIESYIADRVYTINNATSTYGTYDIYVLTKSVTETTTINLDIHLVNAANITVSFDKNIAVTDLVLPDSYTIETGDPVGDIEIPYWYQIGKVFAGYSSDGTTKTIIESSYVPNDNITLYAWFEDKESSKYGYGVVCNSSNHESGESGILLKKYCGAGEPNSSVTFEDINGYTTPSSQTLTSDNQVFNLEYTINNYTITYDLDDGSWPSGSSYKSTYNIEDSDYTPPTPEKEGYTFKKWYPESIPAGSTGNKTLKAIWIQSTTTVTGSEINTLISELGTLSTITQIVNSNAEPASGIIYRNISVAGIESQIKIWLEGTILKIYSDSGQIVCNSDMSGAFSGMNLSGGIAALSDSRWVCNPYTNISNLFNGCSGLTDGTPIQNWGYDGTYHQFSSLTGAFKNTPIATDFDKLPNWYLIGEGHTITLKSSTGITLQTVDISTYESGTIYYAPEIAGYTDPDPSYIKLRPGWDEEIIYTPIQYTISYNVTFGGSTLDPDNLTWGSIRLTNYTIELTEDYTPPSVNMNPAPTGVSFSGWSPSKIEAGDYGNVTFSGNFGY